MKTILSLFDFTGNWSKPYLDNGYNVVQVDVKHGIDVMTWDYKTIDKESVYGILAAVPCTDYSVSGARWFAAKDKDGRTEKSNLLTQKTMEIINYFNPEFWVIENPVSRIERLNPNIGKRQYIFDPHDFAGYLEDPVEEQYRKRTCLWGKFNNPVKKEMPCLDIDKIHMPTRADGSKIGWNTEECKVARQSTPNGFAIAFYESNNEED